MLSLAIILINLQLHFESCIDFRKGNFYDWQMACTSAQRMESCEATQQREGKVSYERKRVICAESWSKMITNQNMNKCRRGTFSSGGSEENIRELLTPDYFAPSDINLLHPTCPVMSLQDLALKVRPWQSHPASFASKCGFAHAYSVL